MIIMENADIFTVAQYGDLIAFQQKLDPLVINCKNTNGSSLLHLSIAGSKFDISLYLVNIGIDVNMVNSDGQTALHLIAKNQNLEVAKAIINKGGNINIRDKFGNNAVWTAVFNCKGKAYDIIKLFLQFNPDVMTKNKAGKSPVDFAIQVGNETLIKLLEGSITNK